MTNGGITANVVPASNVAYANTNYQFTITPQNPIALNGYIMIQYPKNVTIPDTSYSQSQCSNFVGFPTTPTCVISSSARTITVNNGFRISSSSTSLTVTFNIPGFVNPLTLDTTDSFMMSTYTSAGNLMDTVTSGITLTMKQVPFIQSVIVTPGSLINAAVTNFTFLVTPAIPVNNSFSVVVTFPSQIIPPQGPLAYTCSSLDTQFIQSVACSNYSSTVPRSVQVVLSLQGTITGINPLQSFRITINGITNPISTNQTDTFNFTINNKQNNVVSLYNTVTNPVRVMTNTPYTISNANFTANTTGAGQNASYTITIFPAHPIMAGGGMIIVYPSQIGVQNTISATVISAVSQTQPTVSVDMSARRIVITNAFQFNYYPDTIGVSVTLTGFVNPLYNTDNTNSFIIMTMNVVGSSYYLIDQVTDGLILNSPCDYPCSTCPTNNPSQCLSCYQTSVLNKLQGQTCVSQCSTGEFYNATSYTCTNCSSSCLSCTGSADFCTQCGIGNLLYLYNNTCLNNCPNGFINNSTTNLCNPCTNNCQNCFNTSSTCTSCHTNSFYPYFYQQSCLNTCPSSISVPLSNYQCGNCDKSCNTCSGVSTNCTSCLSYMKFDPIMGTCLSVCQAGLQIYNQTKGTCDYCDSDCKTCAGNTTTCTSCKGANVLNQDNTCQTTCSGIDQVAINSTCLTCQLPCAQCTGTTNTCTKCQENYLLYNSTCVQYCPTKFVADNSTSQCVYQGLICPDGFNINTAGDGCIPIQFQCPSGYIINQQKTACVPGPGSIVPFPFLFLSACLGILVLGSHIKDKFFTKVLTCLIALIGMQELLIYGLMICYTGYMQLWIPFALTCVAFTMLVTSNIIFFVFYKKEIITDPAFSKWIRHYPKSEKYICLLSILVNFKSIKLLYSGFYGLESCLAQFNDPMRNFFRPMRMVTYFSFIFVYLPIIAADVLIVFKVEWGYQLLILAIESFVLAILITVLTFIEFRHPEQLLMSGDEQYIRIKPKRFGSEQNVMGGNNLDVDESTLIRSHMVDDDYEIQLRKKALAQILEQVGKNFLQAQAKGVHLGTDIDKVMTKFDEDRIKLRRAFSLESIGEEDSWVASGDELEMTKEFDNFDEEDEYNQQRRYSYPLSPRSLATVPDPQFKQTIREIQQANMEFFQDNVYADCKPIDKAKETRRKKTVSRRTQTYLRELLMMEGDNLQDSDMEVVLDEDAEIDFHYAKGLIDGVIDVLSETDSVSDVVKKKKKVVKKSVEVVGASVKKEEKQSVPDFELADIMGEFEIDDLGNFIILRGERGELLDKKEKRVNRRGYTVDRFGNVVNTKGQIIFKAIELDSDDEIPPPFGFEKRRQNLLNLGDDDEFRVTGTEKQVPDDEDLIDRELEQIRKSGKKRKRQLEDGQIVDEVDDENSSVDSLMAESPAKYGGPKVGDTFTKQVDDDVINRVTQKKIPKRKPPVAAPLVAQEKPQRASLVPKLKKKVSPKNVQKVSDTVSERPKTSSSHYNAPPRRIKREDTRELFPSLAIESIEQKKLFRIAESIGGMASQIADERNRFHLADTSIQIQNTKISQGELDRLERLKQEHFQDIINESQMIAKKNQHSDVRLNSRGPLEKVYGNLGDVVSYEERILESQRKGQKQMSPTSSQVTFHKNRKHDNRRMTGLESIYLQKFEKKQAGAGRKGNYNKAKFRTTLQQFVDDPELLVDDGIDHQRQNEMSLMVVDKLDRLQKQYMTSTSTNRLSSVPITSMGFNNPIGGSLTAQNWGGPLTGLAIARKTGSTSGFTINPDTSQLEPVMKGNWVDQPQNQSSLE